MGPCPLPEAQTAWMKRLMTRTVEMMGEEFECKLDAIDAEVRNIKATQQDMVTKDELKEAVEQAIADARAELMLEIRKNAAAPSVGPSNPASPSPSSCSGMSGGAADVDNRTAATMGSLAWDCCEISAVARAKDALQRSGGA